MDTKPEPYDLDELIQILEDIFNEKNPPINPPKAAYTLALEIKKIKKWQDNYESDSALNSLWPFHIDSKQACEEVSREIEDSLASQSCNLP
jgi:hypothetical protein